MNSFEGVNIQDIISCPDISNLSGLKTRLYYAPANFFMKINLPTAFNSYEEIIKIPEGEIEFKAGGWSVIDILVDENELKNQIPGSQQRKRSRSELDIYVLGLRAEVLGFIEMHKNTPLVFGVVDANNQNWIMGNLRNRAFFDNADFSSAKKYEDNSGAAIKITCNAPIFLYSGLLEAVELAGSFTKGFSLGYKS